MTQRTMIGIVAAVLLGLARLASGESAGPDPLADPPIDPGLPKVLLIGDSICIGYTLRTRELLAGEANVLGIGTNGGPTLRGIDQIDTWLRDGDWDVIHFNWGLHDIRRDRKEGQTGPVPWQVDADQYRANLEALVQRLKQTGAVLIWATTTPVPEGAQSRVAGDEVLVNAIAAPIMAQHGVRVNDLHAHVLPRLSEFQRPANVHFTEEGSAFLAEAVATAIRDALPAE